MTFAEKVIEASIESVEIKVGAVTCSVLILPASFNPSIPYFVGMLREDRYFISDAVPERFRLGFIGHEANCFALKACGRKGHCVAALDVEMRYVPRGEEDAYLAMRLQMFEGLISFYEGRPHSDFIDEIVATRDKLRTLV